MIKQIKTFVEQLKNKYPSWQLKLAMDELFSFLDTLKEPIDKWSNKDRTARVKETGEIVHGFTDGQGHFDIPTDHNEFIRYNLDELEFDTLQEQPVDWQKVAEAHAKDQPLGQDNDGNLVYLQEQPVCEELGDEIDRFRETEEYLLAEKAGETDVVIARHFAKWGAEHSKK